MSRWCVQLPAGPHPTFISLFFLPRRGPNLAGVGGANGRPVGAQWKDTLVGLFPGGLAPFRGLNGIDGDEPPGQWCLLPLPHQGQGTGWRGRVFQGPDALQSWRGERVCEVSALHSM